mmetsp:Transcript_82443/g.218756  ORF Transcript_82443/g.218756 Transcript_82443/m.218756 type:complete len:417 (+) Transcript_82443:463-1713(+)
MAASSPCRVAVARCLSTSSSLSCARVRRSSFSRSSFVRSVSSRSWRKLSWPLNASTNSSCMWAVSLLESPLSPERVRWKSMPDLLPEQLRASSSSERAVESSARRPSRTLSLASSVLVSFAFTACSAPSFTACTSSTSLRRRWSFSSRCRSRARSVASSADIRPAWLCRSCLCFSDPRSASRTAWIPPSSASFEHSELQVVAVSDTEERWRPPTSSSIRCCWRRSSMRASSASKRARTRRTRCCACISADACMSPRRRSISSSRRCPWMRNSSSSACAWLRSSFARSSSNSVCERLSMSCRLCCRARAASATSSSCARDLTSCSLLCLSLPRSSSSSALRACSSSSSSRPCTAELSGGTRIVTSSSDCRISRSWRSCSFARCASRSSSRIRLSSSSCSFSFRARVSAFTPQASCSP